MSNTSSTFACFADAAESKKVVKPVEILSSTSITVNELLTALQKMVTENPESANLIMYHEEFGSLVKTRTVSLEGKKIVFY